MRQFVIQNVRILSSSRTLSSETGSVFAFASIQAEVGVRADQECAALKKCPAAIRVGSGELENPGSGFRQ
jgi:hypothetical protein